MGMRVSNLYDNLELPILKTPKFYYNGNGTKFLSDDGTYKEVSGGSEPVIIELINTNKNSVTDEQINAAKNANIKIKVVSQENNINMVTIPFIYLYEDDYIMISAAVNISSTSYVNCIQFKLYITNKIIEIVNN